MLVTRVTRHNPSNHSAQPTHLNSFSQLTRAYGIIVLIFIIIIIVIWKHSTRNQTAAYPPPRFQAAGGMLHGARQNFRTSLFHWSSSFIVTSKFSVLTITATFRTSTAHANFGLPILLLFAWICSAVEFSWNITWRIWSSEPFLYIFPKTSNCCSNKSLLNWTAFTYESTSLFEMRLQ